MKTKKKYSRLKQRLFWSFALLILWEVSVKVSKVSPLLFPSVEEVLKTLYQDFFHGDLLLQTVSSLEIIGIGMLIAVILSVLLSLLSLLQPAAEGFIDTITTIAHPLPGLALLPLIIVWFGTGSKAIIAIIVHSALWPLLLNLLTGFSNTPVIYTDIGKNLSMSTSAITLEIRLRYALPYLISGLKIGWARAWRAFISAEMVFGAVGKKGGLGFYILTQRTFMDTAGLFAGIILIVMIGILVEDLLFSLIEKKTIRKWGMNHV